MITNLLEPQSLFNECDETSVFNKTIEIESISISSEMQKLLPSEIDNWFQSWIGSSGNEPPLGSFREESSDGKVPHILIVDDDEINTYVLVRTINSLERRYRCSTAPNGKAGLNMLKEFEKENIAYPDLILLDLEMPILDGFQFLNKYQNDFLPVLSQTEIMVVSSSSLNTDRQKVFKYEFVSDFVSKPFPLSLLNSY